MTYSGQNPFFSIIIPVYNSAQYLGECLESILNQDFKNFEILCVNDGSSDNSLEVVQRYSTSDSRVFVWSQENQGQSCARNFALKKAKGSYILFVDSDDALAPETLSKTYDTLKKDSIDVLYFDAITLYDNAKLKKDFSVFKTTYQRTESLGRGIPGSELFLRFKRDHSYRVSVCMCVIKRDHLEENKIDFPAGILYEDNVFTLKCMLLAKSASHINEPFYVRRIRSESTMTSRVSFRNCADYFDVWTQMCEFALTHRLGEDVEVALLDETDHILELLRNMYRDNFGSDEAVLSKLPFYKREMFKRAVIGQHSNAGAQALQEEINKMKTSITWRAGRAITCIPRWIKRNIQ